MFAAGWNAVNASIAGGFALIRSDHNRVRCPGMTREKPGEGDDNGETRN